MPGEYQIYKFISVSNFNRILVGLEELEKIAISEISKICSPYNLPVLSFKDAEYLDKEQKILSKK